MQQEEPKSPDRAPNAQQVNNTTTSPSNTTPSPVPPPVPVATHPNRGAFKPPTPHRPIPEPNRLSPSDAFYAQAPPRLRPLTEIRPLPLNGSAAANAAAAALRPAVASLRPPPAIPTDDKRKRSSRRRKRGPPVWKKLLWVKQGYPDNYTDTETFLKHMERNPRFRPYEFWPLVGEVTVIVQHVCSVVIFVCCFVGIVQDRISSTSVVTGGSTFTLLGWALWDYWIGQEEKEKVAARLAKDSSSSMATSNGTSSKRNSLTVPLPRRADRSSMSSLGSFERLPRSLDESREDTRPSSNSNSNNHLGLGLTLSNSNFSNNPYGKRDSTLTQHSRSTSGLSIRSISPVSPKLPSPLLAPSKGTPTTATTTQQTTITTTKLSPRVHTRLKTFKSGLLIYFTLLGLAPILQSLTKSTSSDSIWALATWLICINIFFFDYGAMSASPTSRSNSSSVAVAVAGAGGGGGAATFPASLSTNAALMASTVLASRLTSTTDVFSLTLFSIQVFGLFPVFRRHLRHVTRRGHYFLTLFLVLAASSGLSIILSTPSRDWWGVMVRLAGGQVVGLWSAAVAMGGCAWWLISLQRYKNVVSGPWDPARPILKARPRGMTDA